jgi:hypothetical protein
MRQWHFYEVHEMHLEISRQRTLQDFMLVSYTTDNCRLTHRVAFLEST